MEIKEIITNKKVLDSIEKRQLSKQFEKVKKYIFKWNLQAIKFKLREPKKDEVYYFRLNKQFRLYAKLYDTTLAIMEISNHQNG